MRFLAFALGAWVGWRLVRPRTVVQPAHQFSYLIPPEFYGNPDGSRTITYTDYGKHPLQ